MFGAPLHFLISIHEGSLVGAGYSRIVPCPLETVEWCVVLLFSWTMRWRRSWRRFADPLFIIIFEDAHYSPRRTNLSLSQGRHSVFHRARLQVLPFVPGEAASVRCFDVVLGKVHLQSWRFIVVRHGSHAHRGVYCFLPFRRFAADIFPFLQARFLQGIVGPNPNCVQSGPLRHVSFSLGFSSTGVAPLPPCSRKLPDKIVKTSVCMLFVPFKHERPSQQ